MGSEGRVGACAVTQGRCRCGGVWTEGERAAAILFRFQIGAATTHPWSSNCSSDQRTCLCGRVVLFLGLDDSLLAID